MPEPTLLQRLKERKMVQWALAYLAGAFVVFQLLDAVADPLGLSTAVQRAVFAVVVVGFFITLVLAWYHGEKGRQRVSGPELLMVAALLVVAGVALSLIGLGEEETGPVEALRITAADRDKPSIAVLPCDNISPEPDSVFYAKGIHEAILLQLSKISALTTLSRTSVLRYEENPQPIPQIGTELGVGFLGECSVQKASDRIRVTFQLVDAGRDEHLWAEEYDADLTTQHLLEIQSDIASRVAESLEAVILPEERARIERLPTASVTAHEAYLLSRHYLENPSTAWEAVRLLELALEEDPGFALAHSGLALAYDILASIGASSPRELWTLAEREAQAALEMDSTLAEPFVVLGDARMIRWDWTGAEEAFRRAIELRPSYATAHQWYSIVLIAQGRIEEALAEGEIAVRVNPRVGGSVLGQAIRLFMARRYEEAESAFEDALRVVERGGLSHWWAGWLYAHMGHIDRAFEMAREALREAREVGWDSAAVEGLTAGIHAHAGNIDTAVGILLDLEQLHEQRLSQGEYLDPYAFWPAYAAVGDLDSAFKWLERAVEVGSWGTLYVGVSPWADPLRDDPRYQSILDRVGLGHLKARFDSLAAGLTTD